MRKMRRSRGPSTPRPRRISCGDMIHFPLSGLHDGIKSVAAPGSGASPVVSSVVQITSPKRESDTAAAETSGRNDDMNPQHNQSQAGTRTRRRESSPAGAPTFKPDKILQASADVGS